ncbi:MAG: MFS transporter [Bacillota bacterium]|nr:MFS transporter [Bacillota bacterium]
MQRYRVLATSCLVCMCLGSGFAWSVNQVGFMEEAAEIFGHDVSATSLALTFTIYTGIVPIPMILGGLLVKKYRIRSLYLLFSAIFCAGILGSGFVTDIKGLYLFYGLFAGFGSASTFNVVFKNLVTVFEDKTGLATGLMTAFYGSSAFICAPVMQRLIEVGGELFNLRVMGVSFSIVMAVCAIEIGSVKSKSTGTDALNNRSDNVGNRVMLKDKSFPLMIIAYTGFATCGLMIISQCGLMAKSIGNIPNVAGIVMAISLANIAGRLFWGPLSDKAGKCTVLIMAASLMTVGGIILLLTGSSLSVFIACSMSIIFAYGGCASCFPAFISDSYGVENSALNYGIICIGYSAGGYIGPITASEMFAHTGAYTTSFIMVATVGVITLICMLILSRTQKQAGPIML